MVGSSGQQCQRLFCPIQTSAKKYCKNGFGFFGVKLECYFDTALHLTANSNYKLSYIYTTVYAKKKTQSRRIH